MAKPLEQVLKPIIPLRLSERKYCGNGCSGLINPMEQEYIESTELDKWYCDIVCLVHSVGAKFVGDDIEWEGYVVSEQIFKEELGVIEHD